MHGRTSPIPDPPPTPSWWQDQAALPPHPPLTGDARVDVCVVGAGVTGCSAALTLAAAGRNVLVIDARDVAGGASGRNGGFLLAGLHLRYPDLVERCGRQRARELYRLTVEARDRLIALAGQIGAAESVRRTGSWRLATSGDELSGLKREAALLAADGHAVRMVDPDELPPALADRVAGGLAFDDDAASQPAAWIGALAAAAEDAGAVIAGSTPALAIGGGDPAQVITPIGTIRADHVVVATEPWTGALLPELEHAMTPYRSQVLAAHAADDSAYLARPAWIRRGWDYVQQALDGTIIAGGEQIEDPSEHAHRNEDLDEADQAAIESWTAAAFGTDVSVVARWAGILNISTDGMPIVGPVPEQPGIVVAGAWGGAGNVLGFWGGRAAALECLGDHRAADIPPEFSPTRMITSSVG